MDPANFQSYLDWFVCLFRVRQAGEVAQNRKGGPPFDDDRRALPQHRVVILSPVCKTVRTSEKLTICWLLDYDKLPFSIRKDR